MVAIFSDSNRARMRYAKESDTTWGVTPANGVTRELRYTGSTLNVQKSTTTSDELRADRMVSDIIETSLASSGAFNVEFSAGSHDDFLEGFAYGLWTRPMTFDSFTGTQLAWTANNTLVITGVDMSLNFVVGRRIRTTGFVNSFNNGYFQIATIAFGTGATTITVTTSTSVVETGTIISELHDANDVIVLNNVAIRSGTGAASTFDSNGTNAFAAAVAAGQLVIGQKVHIDGLGYENGNIVFSAGTPSAGTIVTISDNTNTYNFQFGGTVPAGSISVTPSAVAATNATNLAAAVNALCALGSLNVAAKTSTGTITFKNLNKTGGSVSKTGDGGTLLAVTNFSGGLASASGIFTLTSVANDTLGVTPAPGTINNSTVAVVVKGSMLRNPSSASTITPHSFSFETGFEDVSQYFITSGHRIGSFSYDIASSAVIKGSFDIQGATTSRQATTKFGNTGSYSVLGTTSTPITNATVNVGAALVNNTALTTAIQSITVKGTNNLRNQMAIGNKFPAGIGSGRIEISGTVVAYFADGSMWDRFINHTTVALNFPMTDGENNHYEWTFPAVVFSTDTVNPAARDQDVIETLEFMTKRDPATNCEFQIDRFSVITPATSF